MLLAVATGAIGGGGMFAVYSYITPILTDRAGVAARRGPARARRAGACGMVAGSLIGGRLVDWRPRRAMLGAFLCMAAVFALFTVTSANAGHRDLDRVPARHERSCCRPACRCG